MRHDFKDALESVMLQANLKEAANLAKEMHPFVKGKNKATRILAFAAMFQHEFKDAPSLETACDIHKHLVMHMLGEE